VRHFENPRNVMLVRHEDLCASPDETISRILSFMGTNDTKPSCHATATDQHVIGNLMRMTFDGRIRLDDRWKQSLTTQDLSWFQTVAGQVNRSYGYLD
jgi:hypothetical protein